MRASGGYGRAKKLTEAAVIEIRERMAAGGTLRRVGRAAGVSHETVRQIWLGFVWKDVEGRRA